MKPGGIVWKNAGYYDSNGNDCRVRADEQSFGELVEALKNIEIRRTLTKGEYGDFNTLFSDGQYKGTLKEGVHRVCEIKAYVRRMQGGRMLLRINGTRPRARYFQSFTELPHLRNFLNKIYTDSILYFN